MNDEPILGHAVYCRHVMSDEPILGQEAIVGKYGLGRVTNLDDPKREIGVTPYVAGIQMRFAPHNVELIPINRRPKR